MTSIAKWFTLFISIFLLSACDSADADRDDITALSLSPATAYIGIDDTQAYSLIATYSDNSTSTVTHYADWYSSDTSIATVDTGVATGVSEGNVTITASLKGVSATATLYVFSSTPTSLVVTPVDETIQQGTQQQYTATLYYEDDTSSDVTDDDGIVWSSSNTSCATIESSGDTTPGLAQALDVSADCETSISAILNNNDDLSDSTDLTVDAVTVTTFDISPTDDSIANGEELQYTATVTYSDGTTYDATTDSNTSWSSSKTSIATIGDDTGYATSVAEGTTTISVSYNSNDASTSLTVTDAYVTELSITPTTASTIVGLFARYTATATYSDDTTADVTAYSTTVWESDNEYVAKMDDETAGKANAVGVGEATITATFSDITADATLIVTSAHPVSLKISPKQWSLPIGYTEQYYASMTDSAGNNHNVTDEVFWSSSDTDKATITPTSGLAFTGGPNTGDTTITAVYNQGAISLNDEATLTVTGALALSLLVTPQDKTIAEEQYQQYVATMTDSDGHKNDVTKDVDWSSKYTNIATIDRYGIAHAGGPDTGNTTIKATYNQGLTLLTDDASLNVVAAQTESISIAPLNPLLYLGTNKQYTATLHYADGRTSDVTSDPATTWFSKDTDYVTISNAVDTKGLATGVKEGKTEIKVTYTQPGSQQLSASTPVDVVKDYIVGYVIEDAYGQHITHMTTHDHDGKKYYAYFLHAGGSKQDVSEDTHWSVSNHPIASVSNGGKNAGLVRTDNNEGYTLLNGKYKIKGNDYIYAVPAEITVTSSSE
ncbi:Ig-like domain-containing protein [Shewanella surugensis]|uniref:Ig-like domain-containing protein n=1 Tax=Shewanella surugensis TaxID=212020 RepID=A0ABT0L7T7_9GAMM|nr:Ig-like domain-containing protein [Shewanella surugensis]MCL1123460.1 Ig-like domain-containing protein [Shewanella surugensis]